VDPGHTTAVPTPPGEDSSDGEGLDATVVTPTVTPTVESEPVSSTVVPPPLPADHAEENPSGPEKAADGTSPPEHDTKAASSPAPNLIEMDDDLPDQPRTPQAPHPAPQAKPRWPLIAGAAALMVLLAAGGWLLVRGHGARDGVASAVKVVHVGENATGEAPEGGTAPAPSREKKVEPNASGSPRRGARPAADHVRPGREPGRVPRTGVLNATVDVSGLASWPPPAAIVYAGKRYRGRSQTFGVGEVPHLRGTRLGDNAASSLKVVGGARVTLFLKPGFVGRSETFVKDCPSLKGRKIRNNRASSLKVEPPDTGPVLWRAGPIRELGVGFELRRCRDAVVVRSEAQAAATYVVAGVVPATGASLSKLVRTRPGLAQALGPPQTAAVRVARGKLAVQLFTRGAVVYAPGSKRGWYRLDER